MPHLWLNLKYIELYRHPRKLTSESSYFFITLQSCARFIQSITASSLSIDPDVYTNFIRQYAIEKAHEQTRINDEELTVGSGERRGSKSLLSPLPVGSPSPNAVVPNLALPGGRIVSSEELSVTEAHLDNLLKLRDFSFLSTEVDELKVLDVPVLLQEYKEVANILLHLQEAYHRGISTKGALSRRGMIATIQERSKNRSKASK